MSQPVEEHFQGESPLHEHIEDPVNGSPIKVNPFFIDFNEFLGL